MGLTYLKTLFNIFVNYIKTKVSNCPCETHLDLKSLLSNAAFLWITFWSDITKMTNGQNGELVYIYTCNMHGKHYQHIYEKLEVIQMGAFTKEIIGWVSHLILNKFS